MSFNATQERPLDPPEAPELTMTQERHVDLIVRTRQANVAKDLLGYGLPGDPDAVKRMMDEWGDDYAHSFVEQVIPLIGADSDEVTPEEALRRYHLIAKATKGWLTPYWDIAVDRGDVERELYPYWL